MGQYVVEQTVNYLVEADSVDEAIEKVQRGVWSGQIRQIHDGDELEDTYLTEEHFND